MDSEQAQQRFYGLLWPHLPAVLRTAQILCGSNAPEAEDVAQETMLKAYRAIDRFEPGTNARAWLLAILRNAWTDRRRSLTAEARNASLEDLAQDPPARDNPERLDPAAVAENPDVLLEQFSDKQMIAALGRLPLAIRWTLLLVDVEGMDDKEAAAALDVPVGTIKSRAHRGRAMLREALLPAPEADEVGQG